MQRMVILAVLAVLTMLAGCAARDPNLAVRGMGEFGRSAGDYTLRVNVYELDAEGSPRLAASDDASFRGFVSRTLSPKGYALKDSGPARYALEVHLLCGNMRTADMGLTSEALMVPAGAVASGYSEQVHYWLPNKGLGTGSRETQDLHDSMQRRSVASGESRLSQNSLGGAPLGRQTPDFCQGRALLVLTPAGDGPKREAFVGRVATEDCRAVSGCPVDTCRTALEHSLVDYLERRF